MTEPERPARTTAETLRKRLALADAAPALLAACEKLLDIIQAKGGTFAMLHQAEIAAATAAIAKAKGETPS